MESYSKNYYHRRKNQENNPNQYDYTPELTKQFLTDNNISFNPRTLMFTQNGKDMKVYLQKSNQSIYSDQERLYRYCSYYKDGKQKFIAVHRLMWLYFKGNIPKGYVIDHINNNSLDNRLENLQLLTRSENTQKSAVGRNQLYYQLGPEEYAKRQQARREKKMQVLENKKRYLTDKIKKLRDRINRQASLSNKLVNQYNERLKCTSHWKSTSKWINTTEQLKQRINEKSKLIEELKAKYRTKLIELDKINQQLSV